MVDDCRFEVGKKYKFDFVKDEKDKENTGEGEKNRKKESESWFYERSIIKVFCRYNFLNFIILGYSVMSNGCKKKLKYIIFLEKYKLFLIFNLLLSVSTLMLNVNIANVTLHFDF